MDTFFLKKGGVVAISWNTYTDKRSEFVTIFEQNGYKVFDDEPFLRVEHRVAQAINRDIIIAKKSYN